MKMKVSQIMRKAVVIDDHILVRDAAKIMSKKDIGSLIIVKDSKVKGIITERDVMRNIKKINSKVKQVMSTKVLTTSPDEDLSEVANLMTAHKIKRVPVVDKEKLVGVITITDVLAHSSGDFGEDFLIN